MCRSWRRQSLRRSGCDMWTAGMLLLAYDGREWRQRVGELGVMGVHWNWKQDGRTILRLE